MTEIKKFISEIPILGYRLMKLREDSRTNGVSVMKDWLNTLTKQQRIKGVILDFGSRNYTIKTYIDSKSTDDFFYQFWRAITRDSIIILSIPDNIDFNFLQTDYHVHEEGVLSENNFKNVFYNPIIIPRYFFDQNKVFLVIHHDGDPIVYLRRTSEK